MTTSWEEFKKKKQKEFGSIVHTPIEQKIEPKQRLVAKKEEDIELFNVVKVTLPPDKKLEHGKVVVIGVSSKEADWWIEHRLKAKTYHDNTDDSKTLVFYEKFSQNATPRERSIYFNRFPVTTEEVPGYNAPKRIN